MVAKVCNIGSGHLAAVRLVPQTARERVAPLTVHLSKEDQHTKDQRGEHTQDHEGGDRCCINLVVGSHFIGHLVL